MTARRLALSAAAMMAGALVVGGCTTARLPGAAAIVDEHTISTEQVLTTTNQLNAALGDKTSPLYNPSAHFSENQTVQWLVLAPFIDKRVAATGRWVPDDAYNTTLAALGHPTESTTAVVRGMLSTQAMSAEDKAAVLDDARHAKISVNPRYGTLDLFNPYAPNWIKPNPTATPTSP